MHPLQPLYDSIVYNGRRYTILAKFNDDTTANQYLEQNPDTGAMCVGTLGVVYGAVNNGVTHAMQNLLPYKNTAKRFQLRQPIR